MPGRTILRSALVLNRVIIRELLSPDQGLQVFVPVGQMGGGFPSACNRTGVETVFSNTMAVARTQNRFFTMQLLCEGFAP